MLYGGVQNPFCNKQIKKEDRDALSFQWMQKEGPNCVELLQFTRLVFSFTLEEQQTNI